MPRLAYANLFASDIRALSGFYAELFGFEELTVHRSPIYRCLDAGGVELGFNDLKAYDLLALGGRQPAPGALAPTTVYLTFELGSVAEVDARTARAQALGGRIIKPGYSTYYNAWQAVLSDPEGHVFRLNHRMELP
jgi:predicted enzyme related to lactoylglutathione lyase